MKSAFRPIAIYLPQFHPIPENDAWWGKGFTEWTNVSKAKPLFKGHYQPHLPADLGFYDLRLSEVREQQAQLAKEYGIYGFCYYHYWFNGRRILERPFQEVFESGKPEFPFMLCWANENWTRVWDGSNKDVLLEQKYSFEDDLKHINSLIPFFKDPRYIKVDGKPVFAIYRSTLFPNMKQTIDIWRNAAAKQGIELYLTRFETFQTEGEEYLKCGFDAAIEFQPHTFFNTYLKRKPLKTLKDEVSLQNILNSIKYRINHQLGKFKIEKKIPGLIFTYKEIIDYALEYREIVDNYKRFRCIMPCFDNVARKKSNFFTTINSTPELFGYWAKEVLNEFKPYSNEENFLFINAWNEWAEGNHLEPCQRWGKAYLEQLKNSC